MNQIMETLLWAWFGIWVGWILCTGVALLRSTDPWDEVEEEDDEQERSES